MDKKIYYQSNQVLVTSHLLHIKQISYIFFAYLSLLLELAFYKLSRLLYMQVTLLFVSLD